MFSNRNLIKMIIPLFIEQFLLMLVGLADTFVVSYAGEAAVSGVSLVNSFNTVFIFLFTALASGGAVIINQYIGKGDLEKAEKSAGQLLMISFLSSAAISSLILLFRLTLLQLLFGKVNDDVMHACTVYLRVSAYSFPALAVYNSGAALCRSTGKTNITMYISGAANIINVIGNIIGVFVLRMGVAGVAYPSLISRTISAVAITIYCFKNKTAVKYKMCNIFIWDSSLLKKVLGIAIPNGVENGVHQLIKVALSSLIALFGTYQIAANGVAQSIWSLSALMGLTMAPVFTTVIGQCMGAGDIKSAEHYFKKLSKITLILSLSWNALVFAATPLFMHFFALSAETKKLVIILVLLHNVVNGAVFPFAGPLGSGLRAAGDVRFTMITSVMLTIFARLIFSYIFGLYLNLGVIGVAFGMNIDVIIRGIMFIHRYKSRKWTSFKLV